ncbi:hypothetical protein SAMN05216279_115113, partial [Pseudomonas oryzihabitans]
MRGASRAAVMNSATALLTFEPSVIIFDLLECLPGREAQVGQ